MLNVKLIAVWYYLYDGDKANFSPLYI